MSVLEVRNLKKSFDKDTVVLKGVDFSLEKGETVAIIGSSGSGKTTLLRCLNFLTVPDEGQIAVNGETLFDAADPNTQKESEIRRKRLHFGLVFQNFNLFPQYTARQNVMLASELLAKEQPDYKAHKKQIHAQIAAHAEELSKHVLMINVDVAAATLGHNIAPVLATQEAVGYVDALMCELGVPCKVKLDIYSSDCVPFADHGVPAINLCRFGAPGADYIHDRRDNLKSGYIDEKALDITLQQAMYLAKRVANAAVFPIRREIANEIRDKVDTYLFRKEKKD